MIAIVTIVQYAPKPFRIIKAPISLLHSSVQRVGSLEQRPLAPKPEAKSVNAPEPQTEAIRTRLNGHDVQNHRNTAFGVNTGQAATRISG